MPDIKIIPKPFSELFNPTFKQREALAALDNYKYLLYGGAKGGGKSYFLRIALIKLLLSYAKRGFRNVKVGLFCEDYPVLKDRQVEKISTEFPSWLGTLSNSQIHGLSFILSEDYGSGILALRNLDEPSKYDSSEFAAIAVDEIAKNKLETFLLLKSILRWKGIDDVKFICSCNPIGIGIEWVTNVFINHKFPFEEKEKELYHFIHATAHDNPHLSEGYYNQLRSLSPELQEAFLKGQFGINAYSFFNTWKDEINVIGDLPSGFVFNKELCRIGIDYGNTTVVSVVSKYRDKYYLLDELLIKNKTKNKKVTQIYDYINGLSLDDVQIICDNNMFFDSTEIDDYVSPAKMLETLGLRIKAVSKKKKKSTNFRIACNNEFKNLIEPDNPRFFVLSKCQYFIEQIKLIQNSKYSDEDFDEDSDNDHSYDSVKYALTELLPDEDKNKDIKSLHDNYKKRYSRKIA